MKRSGAGVADIQRQNKDPFLKMDFGFAACDLSKPSNSQFSENGFGFWISDSDYGLPCGVKKVTMD